MLKFSDCSYFQKELFRNSQVSVTGTHRLSYFFALIPNIEWQIKEQNTSFSSLWC